MSEPRVFSLDSIRADGWFERIGQGMGSFQSLCDIVGERFFAFSMITGARIVALTVDRKNPDNTMVDFVIGAEQGSTETEEVTDDDAQRLPLPDFRRRLVAALLAETNLGDPPQRDTDLEALQHHIGIRYLLLAPLFGFSLRSLIVHDDRSTVQLQLDGKDIAIELPTLQRRLRLLVREELDRVNAEHSTIELAHVALAENAASNGDWREVMRLLGMWPAPLAIFLRTPEGQMIAPETSDMIAKGLGLLGVAYVRVGDIERGEEIFRLSVQYAVGDEIAAKLYLEFGLSVLEDGRPGESIAMLRRALQLGETEAQCCPALARAYANRGMYVAAAHCVQQSLKADVPEREMTWTMQRVAEALSGVSENLSRVGWSFDWLESHRG